MQNQFAAARDAILFKRFGPKDDFAIPMAHEEYDYSSAPAKASKQSKAEAND